MSSQTRLFVGNLPENTSEDLLYGAFSDYGQITNLELKSKSLENDQKKFAFVTLSGTHYNIESCIKHFSTESFNGNKLYVTRARESFLERLQRERQQAQEKETEKNYVSEELPKEIPVLKLSEKLNPRKRKQDSKSLLTDIYQKTHNSFESTNNNVWTELSPAETKTKTPLSEKDKRKLDSDKKRMDSMKKKRQEFKQKQMIIKTGLVGVDNAKNKKIVFSDNEGNAPNTVNSNNAKESKKGILFDDSESDGEVNFEIKKQYEGRTGQKVLDLQSRYKSDKRFILDERFIEDEKTTEEKGDQIVDEQDDEIAVGQFDEKAKQLNILQDVLGVAIKSHIRQPSDITDNKKRSKLGMLRFDPTQPDHAKFLATVENNQISQKKNKKKSTEKQIEETKSEIEKQAVSEVKVSKEQFYKISDTLKEAIAQPTTFSLRSLFSKNEDDEKEFPVQDPTYIPLEKQTEKKVKNPLDPGEKNPFVYDSSDSEDDVPAKETKPESSTLNTDIKTVWKENLFFTKIDNRLKDGLVFFSKSTVNEVEKERRQLKSLMKKRIYNKDRKNQMFQKKIGGRKKSLKKSYKKKS